MKLAWCGARRSSLAVLVALATVLGGTDPALAAPAPALASVAPASAPGGATVTLRGSGLTGVTGVTFNGAAATFTVVDDAQLTATVPATATDGTLSVTSPDGTAGLLFDVDEPPPPVSGLVARPGDSAVALRWAAPASDVVEVVVRRTEGTSAPATPTDGVAVAADPVRGAVDTGLTNGKTYAYALWTRDAAGSLGSAVSVTAVPVVPTAPDLRISLSAGSVTHLTVVRVYGWLLAPDGRPIPGERVTLLTRPRGAASFAGTATAVTGVGGQVAFSYRVLGHTDFLLRRVGDAFDAEARSATPSISARHGLTSRLVPAVVELGGTALLEGRVGASGPGVRVRVEGRVGTAWYLVTTVATDAAGVFRAAIRPTAGGERVLRAVTVADTRHNSATGTALRLVTLARTLREGSSGADVLALEHRLADLRYDVGPISGVFDYDTRLAVMAFQKVHGLPRTGVADLATRARLGAPYTPRLRYLTLGLSVEIDLTKQVLYFARDGVVQRILPVSSGNNELYTVDGITSRAVTPVGNFRVTRKIDGIRISRLGQLFQPAYFLGGFAIHGSPSVPGYPASHGCVRVTKTAMNRLFPLLPVGTPVRLYH